VEPFTLVFLDAIEAQHVVYLMVGENRAIVAHGGFFKNDLVLHTSGADLLADPFAGIPGSVANLE